jgi:hypothetical protein
LRVRARSADASMIPGVSLFVIASMTSRLTVAQSTAHPSK